MSHSNTALAKQLMEWFDTLSRIGCSSVEDDSMDVLRVAGDMRRMARFLQHREQCALWDEAVAALGVELDRLDLKELRMEEEVTLQGVPPEEWLYVINLTKGELYHLRDALSRLDIVREEP